MGLGQLPLLKMLKGSSKMLVFQVELTKHFLVYMARDRGLLLLPTATDFKPKHFIDETDKRVILKAMALTYNGFGDQLANVD